MACQLRRTIFLLQARRDHNECIHYFNLIDYLDDDIFYFNENENEEKVSSASLLKSKYR
jgi:hypothetical protein